MLGLSLYSAFLMVPNFNWCLTANASILVEELGEAKESAWAHPLSILSLLDPAACR